MKLKSHL